MLAESGHFDQCVDTVAELVGVEVERHADATNLFNTRRLKLFSVTDEFFVELFAGAQPDITDGNVLVGNVAGQADQISREVDDFHLLAHVEHEDLLPCGKNGRLQHEFDRLRNEHEVAADLRMRDGDGSTGANLVHHPRNDAAIAAEDVAEPNSDEAAVAASRA